jgi:hypothetical protein
MTPTATDAGLPPSFRERLRAVEDRIEWRSAGPPRGRTTVRTAHLFQEEARVARTETGRTVELRVDSGPVGAIVLLLEVDRRGSPSALGAANAGRDPAFPTGALVARWGTGAVPTDSLPRLADLVELARYALP